MITYMALAPSDITEWIPGTAYVQVLCVSPSIAHMHATAPSGSRLRSQARLQPVFGPPQISSPPTIASTRLPSPQN